MNSEKTYYLETNALYSLVNCLDLILEKINVHTSLYALEEIVSGICEDNFFKRKGVLTKISRSKLKIYPYMPNEMILAAYGIDISKSHAVLFPKKYIYDKINAIISSNSYKNYRDKILELYKIDVENEKKDEDNHDCDTTKQLCEIIFKSTKPIMEKKKKEKNICKKYGIKNLSELPPEKIEEVNYTNIDVNKIFGFSDNISKDTETTQMEREVLRCILNSLGCTYNEEDIETIIKTCQKEKLTAFLLGNSIYSFYLPFNGGIPKRNDIKDISHLIYLENDNYVIVTDDKIFDKIVMGYMRINTDELKNIISQ